MNRLAWLAATTLAALALPVSASAQSLTLCVYDPMGASGPAYKMADTYRLKAKEQFGVDLTLKAYVEEKTAGDDLTAGRCAGAVLTGVRVRSFGLASSSIEAIGALPTYDLLKSAIGALSSTGAASLAANNGWETAGIYPAGAIYLYVRDGSIRTASQLAGRKIAAISDDAAAQTMIREIGASGISASTATFGPMFNSGSVDACYGPATAYEPLELYRGLGSSGGIIDFPLAQLTFQVVVNQAWFPAGFGQWGRTFAASQFDAAKAAITQAEAKVSSKKLAIPDADKPGYEQKFQSVRLAMKSAGVYNGSVLSIMRRARCKADATRAECATQVE